MAFLPLMGNPRAQALLHILLIFRLHLGGFLSKDLRNLLGEYLDCPPEGPGSITPGRPPTTCAG